MVEEPESERVQQELARHELVSSRLLLIEARRAVARRGIDRLAAELERALDNVDLIDIDSAITVAASRLGPPGLRSLDAIHLATALRTPSIAIFLCHDALLAEAARTMGLPVEDFR